MNYRRHRPEPSDEHQFRHYGKNRYICDVLDEMRKLVQHNNVGPLMGLIEEAQSLANRMEAALSDQKDLISLKEETALAKKAYRQLEREYKALHSKVKSKRPKKKS